MPSFEGDIVRRRAAVRGTATEAQRAALQAEVDALSLANKPDPGAGSIYRPSLIATLWVDDDPRRGLPFDAITGDLADEWAGLGQPWLNTLAEVAWAELNMLRCWGCGAHVGYGDHERELPGPGALEFRWTALALCQAADPGSEGSVITVQCEACAPTVDLQPWPENVAERAAVARAEVASALAIMCTETPKRMHLFEPGAPRCRCGRMAESR